MIPILAMFLVGMALTLGSSVYFWGQRVSARNSALILDRVSPQEVVAYRDLQAVGIDPTRLAASSGLQAMLHDVPLVHELARLLSQSGASTSVAQLLAYMVLSGLSLGIFLRTTGGKLPAAICMGAMASATPLGYFYYLKLKRTAAFEKQLPQALELISLYLRSGRSLPQAFLAAAEEIGSPAHEEFSICAETYRLGRPLDVALKTLAVKYADLVGLRFFAVAVSVLGQTGGNLVEVLERIKKNLDASMVFAFKLRAVTSEARMSGYFLGAAPGIFMLCAGILSPTYLNNFFSTALGLVLFASFIFLWLLGGAWMFMLLRAKA